ILDTVIADVAGHSFGSALLMTEARSVLHAKVNAEYSPGKLLAEVNDLLFEDLNRSELLLSMFYARLDIKNSTLSYANAGHCRPLLYRSGNGGSFEELDADGLLMGVRMGVYFEEKALQMGDEDILCLFTDGIIESENSDGEYFGDKRFREVIAEFCHQHPEEIITAIFQNLAKFIDGMDLSDDMTITIMKVVSS
ncbi:MAG: PP2C family protein-serine/threonine phosphatase, partial [Pseudomonadota bacterium]